MWEDYAKTLNKSTNDLTLAEKRHAELAGIMQETQHQVGDAAKYAQEFSGAQAKAAAETLKLQQALGGAMVPILGTVMNLLTPLIGLVTDFINQNPILSAAIIASVATLAALATGILAVVSALQALKPAIAAVTALMATNPIILAIVAGLTLLVGIVTAITAQTQKAKKAQNEYNASLEKYNKIRKEGITKTEIPQVEEEAKNLEELINKYDNLTNKYKELKKVADETTPTMTIMDTAERETGISAQKLTDDFKKLGINIDVFGGNMEEARQKLSDLKKAISDAQKLTIIEYNDQAKVIAQKKVAVMETENLIKTYKNAEKGSGDWNKAQKTLAEQFLQFASAAGVEITAIEKLTDAKNASITAEWKALQDSLVIAQKRITANVAVKESELALLRSKKDLIEISQQEVGSAQKGFALSLVNKAIADAETAIQAEKDAADVLSKLANTPIENVMGIKPADYNNDFKSYENVALDSAMKIHNHRVRMAELSKEEEISSLESILATHAQTADERMDLEEQIYQAKQELRDRDLQATQKAIDDEAKKLADRTANSERWLSREKSTGNLTGQEEIDGYNRIIKYHREYLDKIKADETMAREDKDRIIAEETAYIQDQQDKIYNIRKEYAERAVNDYIEAVRKQYDTEESLENERLNNKLKALNKEYSDRENAIRQAERADELASLYTEEKKYQNAATKEGQEKLKSIRAEIANLLKEGEKERLDTEKESKQAAIEQEIADNKDKYRRLREDLEVSQRDMLAASKKFAADANTEITNSTNTIARSMTNIIKQFDSESTSMVRRGLDKLRELINGYKSIMGNISLSPINLQAKIGTAGMAGAAASGIVVNVTDNGDKYINGKDEAIDYDKELFNTAENAVRQWGGKL
jgi:hypothetical protein